MEWVAVVVLVCVKNETTEECFANREMEERVAGTYEWFMKLGFPKVAVQRLKCEHLR